MKVFVRPNAYEAGRANIAIYNWDHAEHGVRERSSILSPGDGFEVRNAADFFGAPVLTGTYSGGSITLPMNNLSVATPIGVVAPNPTGPEFNAFVLLPASPGGAPTPTHTAGAPTATRTPTRTPTRTATRTPTKTPTGPAAYGDPDTEPDPHADALAHRQPDADPDTFADGDAHAHPHAHPDAGRKPGPPAHRGRGTASDVPDGERQRLGRVRREAGSHDGRRRGHRRLDLQRAESGHLCRLVPGQVSQLDRRLVLREDGRGDRGRLRHGGRHVVAELAVDAAEREGGHGVPLTLNPRTFSLSAGSHTLEFRGRETNTRVDRVIVTNDLSFVPNEVP